MMSGLRDFRIKKKEAVRDVHNKMDGACGTHKGNAKCILEKLTGRDHVVNLDVHWR
jgi:hypothetical protein